MVTTRSLLQKRQTKPSHHKESGVVGGRRQVTTLPMYNPHLEVPFGIYQNGPMWKMVKDTWYVQEFLSNRPDLYRKLPCLLPGHRTIPKAKRDPLPRKKWQLEQDKFHKKRKPVVKYEIDEDYDVEDDEDDDISTIAEVEEEEDEQEQEQQTVVLPPPVLPTVTTATPSYDQQTWERLQMQSVFLVPGRTDDFLHALQREGPFTTADDGKSSSSSSNRGGRVIYRVLQMHGVDVMLTEEWSATESCHWLITLCPTLGDDFPQVFQRVNDAMNQFKYTTKTEHAVRSVVVTKGFALTYPMEDKDKFVRNYAKACHIKLMLLHPYGLEKM